MISHNHASKHYTHSSKHFFNILKLSAHLKVREFSVFHSIDNRFWVTGRVISSCILLPCTERGTRGGDSHILISSLWVLVLNEGQQSIFFFWIHILWAWNSLYHSLVHPWRILTFHKMLSQSARSPVEDDESPVLPRCRSPSSLCSRRSRGPAMSPSGSADGPKQHLPQIRFDATWFNLRLRRFYMLNPVMLCSLILMLNGKCLCRQGEKQCPVE